MNCVGAATDATTNQLYLFLHAFYALNTHERKTLLTRTVERLLTNVNVSTLMLADYALRHFVDCGDAFTKYVNANILNSAAPKSCATLDGMTPGPLTDRPTSSMVDAMAVKHLTKDATLYGRFYATLITLSYRSE